jgi:hypothetical protein
MLPVADLSITKSDDPDPVMPGDNLTYTIDMTNIGIAPGTQLGPGVLGSAVDATNVVVIDTLSPDVGFVSANSTLGTPSYDGSTHQRHRYPLT